MRNYVQNYEELHKEFKIHINSIENKYIIRKRNTMNLRYDDQPKNI